MEAPGLDSSGLNVRKIMKVHCTVTANTVASGNGLQMNKLQVQPMPIYSAVWPH